MNKDIYINYLNNVNKLNSNSLNDIKLLLDEYPYFQTYWMLYIKNLHKIDDVRYNSQLKLASAYVTDRNILYQIINQDENKEELKETEQNYIDNSENINTGIYIEADFLFEKNEKNSLNKEYLSYNTSNIVNNNLEGKIKIDDKKQTKNKLIDKFIKENKNKIQNFSTSIQSTENKHYDLSEDFEFFSETLAKIYIEQGHFEKALLTYEKLYLKYPEKSIYFADRINKVKELIKNNNK